MSRTKSLVRMKKRRFICHSYPISALLFFFFLSKTPWFCISIDKEILEILQSFAGVSVLFSLHMGFLYYWELKINCRGWNQIKSAACTYTHANYMHKQGL